MECLVFCSLKKKSPAPKTVRKIVLNVLKREHRPGMVSVHLIADTKMRRLQKQYRGKSGTTDVLSFATKEGDWPGKNDDLGDIFLSIPKITRQAREWGVSFSEEFNRMLIHGVLHILGYDHITDKDAKIMFAKQEKYLQSEL